MKISLILITILSVLLVLSNEFENHINKLSVYNDDSDSILINNFPDETLEEMTLYMNSADYLKKYIAVRILSAYSNSNEIALSMISSVPLEYILEIADSSFNIDLILDDAERTDNESKIAIIKFLGKRDRKEDIDIICSLINDRNYTVHLTALYVLSEHSYCMYADSSIILNTENADFRESTALEKITEQIRNKSNSHGENND